MSKHRLTPFFAPIDHTRKKVYVSGPMTGYPESNAPAFEQASQALREMGYSVCNPVDTSDLLGELTHSQYLRFDFERVLEADFVVALDGWEKSLGATAELLVATRIGTKCWRWSTFTEYDLITAEDVQRALGKL